MYIIKTRATMNIFSKAIILVTICFLCFSCTKDTVVLEDQVDYSNYSPGFTGYSTGFDGYGDYNDGYGPSFWNSRYNFNTNYSSGYVN